MVDEYKRPYQVLWHGIIDAISAIQEQNFGTAIMLLKQAQADAEEAYISKDDRE